MTRNEPTKTIGEPEDQLILAVFIRARLDLLYGSQRLRLDAAAFFRREGIDPESVQLAWADAAKVGRPARSQNGQQAAA